MSIADKIPTVCPLVSNDGFCSRYTERRCEHKSEYLNCADFSAWFWSQIIDKCVAEGTKFYERLKKSPFTT